MSDSPTAPEDRDDADFGRSRAGAPTSALESTARQIGMFIRSQRTLAGMSLRELASLARVSNPYLSQLERGQHEPSLRVLLAIADALEISADVLLAEAGVLARSSSADERDLDTERAIRSDARLTPAQKEALLAVYRSYVAMGSPNAGDGSSGTATGPSE